MALVIDDGTIAKAFYPVFPPGRSAAEVVAWLRTAPKQPAERADLRPGD